jgi:hypothetical protein
MTPVLAALLLLPTMALARPAQYIYSGAPTVDFGWISPGLTIGGDTLILNFDDSVADPLVTVQWGSTVYTTHFGNDATNNLFNVSTAFDKILADFRTATVTVKPPVNGDGGKIAFKNVSYTNFSLTADIKLYQDTYHNIYTSIVPILSDREQNLGFWASDLAPPQEIPFVNNHDGGILAHPTAWLTVKGYDQNGVPLSSSSDEVAVPAGVAQDLSLIGGRYELRLNNLPLNNIYIDGSYHYLGGSSSDIDVDYLHTLYFKDDWLFYAENAMRRFNYDSFEVGPLGCSEFCLNEFTLSLVAAGINTTAGLSGDNPLFPISNNNGIWDFNIGGQTIEWVGGGTLRGGFFDPEVATGYTYEAGNDIAFAGVMISSVYGDGNYSLWLWDELTSDYIDSGESLLAGDWFNFLTSYGEDGVAKFQVRGISTEYLVDPDNPFAFVTALTFLGDGEQFSMTPMTTLVSPSTTSPVPVPPALGLLVSGLLAVAGMAYRNNRRRGNSKLASCNLAHGPGE